MQMHFLSKGWIEIWVTQETLMLLWFWKLKVKLGVDMSHQVIGTVVPTACGTRKFWESWSAEPWLDGLCRHTMSCEILMVCRKHVLNSHTRSSVPESDCSRHCFMHRTCNYRRKSNLCMQCLGGRQEDKGIIRNEYVKCCDKQKHKVLGTHKII